VYEIVEDVGGSVTAYYVSVPAGAGPYWTGDILASAPDALTSAVWAQYPTRSLYVTKQTLGTPIAVNTNSLTPLPMNPAASAAFSVVNDPDGMLFAGPWDYYGAQPAYSVLGMRPGLWAVEVFVTLATSSTTGKRAITFSNMEPTWDNADVETFFGNPGYQATALGELATDRNASAFLIQGGSTQIRSSGLVWVPTTGTVTGGRAAMQIAVYQNSGSNTTLTDYGVTIRPVA
jgi:hypothetical protein